MPPPVSNLVHTTPISEWPTLGAQPRLLGVFPRIDAAWLDRAHDQIARAPAPSAVWWVAAAVIALAACAVMVRLVRSGAKGARRCYRCRYSMAGIDTLTCPECGRTARSEHELHRARRRPLLALLLGLPLLVAGVLLAALPVVRSRGLVGSLPTWAYLHALDFDSLNFVNTFNPSSVTFIELARRARSDESRPAAARLDLMRRIDPGWFDYFPRSAWVRGEPIYAREKGFPMYHLALTGREPTNPGWPWPDIDPDADDESYTLVWRDPTAPFPPPEAGTITVLTLFAPYNRLANNLSQAPSFQLRVRAVDSVDDLLVARSGPDTDSLVAANLAPRFVRPVGQDTGLGHLQLIAPFVSSPPDPALTTPRPGLPTLGVRVELVRHSRVMATASFFGDVTSGRPWNARSYTNNGPGGRLSMSPLYDFHLFAMTGAPEDLAAADAALSAAPDNPAALDGWALRLIGDGLLALRDPTATTYWAGTLEFRPRVCESGAIAWDRVP